jgi:hypothetical protein
VCPWAPRRRKELALNEFYNPALIDVVGWSIEEHVCRLRIPVDVLVGWSIEEHVCRLRIPVDVLVEEEKEGGLVELVVYTVCLI